MPFSPAFDDVYSALKSAVESALADLSGRCFRLDESRPAGRITDRLLSELSAADLCVADVTDGNANVMWELGFAMALRKPVIVIVQQGGSLPFDIKDLQSVFYDRGQLTSTLGQPLRRIVVDTLANTQGRSDGADQARSSELIGSLLQEMAALKIMVAEAVGQWKPPNTASMPVSRLAPLVGAWVSPETNSHIYARIVSGELVAPYCYGANTSLTGVYYAWRQTGDYWFGRFKWFDEFISGFAFLKPQSTTLLSGAWWSSEEENGPVLEFPPTKGGVVSTWRRAQDLEEPHWAVRFFEEVDREGLLGRIARI
jgi:hypothetical protein